MQPEDEQVFQASTEHTKLFVDILKHLTTIASGAVVLIATFMDKVKPVHLRLLIPFAIGLLLVGIVSSTDACFQLSNNLYGVLLLRILSTLPGTDVSTKAQQDMKRVKKTARRGLLAARIAFYTFSLGMILIGVYVIGNF
jgi:hypothetical protein